MTQQGKSPNAKQDDLASTSEITQRGKDLTPALSSDTSAQATAYPASPDRCKIENEKQISLKYWK